MLYIVVFSNISLQGRYPDSFRKVFPAVSTLPWMYMQ